MMQRKCRHFDEISVDYFTDVTLTTSNVENVSIWWRHHVVTLSFTYTPLTHEESWHLWHLLYSHLLWYWNRYDWHYPLSPVGPNSYRRWPHSDWHASSSDRPPSWNTWLRPSAERTVCMEPVTPTTGCLWKCKWEKTSALGILNSFQKTYNTHIQFLSLFNNLITHSG